MKNLQLITEINTIKEMIERECLNNLKSFMSIEMNMDLEGFDEIESEYENFDCGCDKKKDDDNCGCGVYEVTYLINREESLKIELSSKISEFYNTYLKIISNLNNIIKQVNNGMNPKDNKITYDIELPFK